jgi:hypothetical protein
LDTGLKRVTGMDVYDNRIIGKRNEPDTTRYLTIRNTKMDAIPKIISLQEESSPYLARYGYVWHRHQLVAVEPDWL